MPRPSVMPENDKYNDDNHVAKLLAEDAKKSSQRYAAVGLSALLPKRPTKNAPKPNTRFLNHIVREADSHNAALKKKEELEARIRLREMRAREERGRDEREDGRERKRQRLSNDGRLSPPDDVSGSRRRDEKDKRPSHRDRLGEKRRSRSPSRKNDSHRDHKRTKNSHPRKKDYHSSKRTVHPQSPERRPEHRHRSKSPPSSSHTHSTRRHHRHEPHPRQRSPATSSTTSDPLSPILSTQQARSKPRPSPPIRGRGAHSSTSNIDKHFSSAYDPALDVQPEAVSDQDDWDMALEALRDRTAWKKKQADRLREAGFGEEEIQRWEKTASGHGNKADGDGDIRDVKWARKGEAREWDLGKKVLD